MDLKNLNLDDKTVNQSGSGAIGGERTDFYNAKPEDWSATTYATATAASTPAVSGQSTTDKLKESAYDVKLKLQDTAQDIKQKVQGVVHDIRNRSSNNTYGTYDQSKDSTYTHDKPHSYGIDAVGHDHSLSADSDILGDTRKQKNADTKEKIKDAAAAPIARASTLLAAGKDKVKEAFSSDKTETKPSEDIFAKDYQIEPAPYQTTSVTDQTKNKVANTAYDAADKAENWIADNKYKLNEQADKAQDWAADAKFKAGVKAQETAKDPASDTRYYSNSQSQTY
jgi:hypothetical protein